MLQRRLPLFGLGLAVVLAGTIHCSLGSFNLASAVSSVDELSDAGSSHWAYDALRDLVEKYDVIEGYPDHTFRGQKAASRWELAAALNALIKSIGRDLARLGGEKADKSDLETLARLQQEFRNELAALQARSSALEARASAIEAKNAEQDQRLTLLERTTLHGDMTVGALADIGAQGVGDNPDGLRDSISAVARLRLTMDVPVKEDNEDSKFGAGVVSTRLIGAIGRFARVGSNAGNEGADYPFNLYSRVSSDVNGFNEGLNTGGVNAAIANGTNTRMNMYVESLFYRQHVKPGVPLLSDWSFGTSDPRENWETSGDLYVGLVRWWDLFDVSPYRGNEMTQFQNNAFINIPGIAVNIAQPTLAYQWHQGLGENTSLDFATALGSANVGDMMSGFNLTYEGRLNYNTAFLGPRFTKPGNIYAGAYHMFMSGNTNFLNTAAVTGVPNRSGGTYDDLYPPKTGHSFYVGWNQEWYKGIGTNVSYLVNNTSPIIAAYTTYQPGPGTRLAAAKQALSAVVNVPVSALSDCWRQKDGFGLGYAFTEIHEAGITGLGFSDTLEHVGEAFYRWQVNDSMNIIPSVQMIVNPLGLEANGVITVLGLRMNFVF